MSPFVPLHLAYGIFASSIHLIPDVIYLAYCEHMFIWSASYSPLGHKSYHGETQRQKESNNKRRKIVAIPRLPDERSLRPLERLDPPDVPHIADVFLAPSKDGSGSPEVVSGRDRSHNSYSQGTHSGVPAGVKGQTSHELQRFDDPGIAGCDFDDLMRDLGSEFGIGVMHWLLHCLPVESGFQPGGQSAIPASSKFHTVFAIPTRSHPVGP